MSATMVKTQKRQLQVRLDTTGIRWCERNGIPNGYALALRRTNGRRVRGDTVIHRRKLPVAAADTDRLSEALDALKSVMITDIDARKQHFCLVKPDGENVPKHTSMRTIRGYAGLPTSEDVAVAEFFELAVDAVAEGLRTDIIDEAELHGDDAVLRGCVRALLERFTGQEIVSAVSAEQHGPSND